MLRWPTKNDVPPEGNGEPAQGVVRWLVSCDESGVHGARYYGFGTLWMAWQRLLGATMAAWERDVSSEVRLDFQRTLAGYLGWKDLRAPTFRGERKINVWMFYDPTRGPRTSLARGTNLRYPLPPRR